MKTQSVVIAAILFVVMAIAVAMFLHNDQQKRTKARATKPPAAKVAQATKQARPTVKAETNRTPQPPRNKGRGDNKPPRPEKKQGAVPVVGMLVTSAMPVTEGADKHVPLHVAREALKLVGTDPVAETIWLDAINNPALSPADRKNLIEDLNEAGFADPKNPTEAELPLIQHRLALIEKLAPTALDTVNAAAFSEAYKDLKNMAARLTQLPQPEQPAMQPQPQPELPVVQPPPMPEQAPPDQPQPEQPAPQPQQ